VSSLALAGFHLAGGVAADSAWSRQPSFSTEPQVLLQASGVQKPVEGMAVIELLEETRITFDRTGCRETHYRYVFRVDHESGLDGWRTIGAIWKPWNQERPVLKARVITPDGLEHTLDQATIGESPVHEDARVFDDRKRLTAPLPKLCVGALAEVEILTRETTPAFPEGTLVSVNLRQPVPVLQTRVVVESPEEMPLKWKVLNLSGSTPKRTVEQGRSRLTLEVGRMDPPEGVEPYEPVEAHPHPALRVTTAPSWEALAKGYDAVVNRQLAGSDLTGRLQGLDGAGQDTRKRINLILERMHREIKYTGLEFGAASFVPRSPAEVLTRGYGDCKDKAALLVGTLRAAGIEAYVALLNTGPGQDVDEGLPGLNHFDHAIVYVPGPEPIWIDATAEYFHAGELPFPDQGRKALIARPGTSALTLIPSTRSQDNLIREVREVHLADIGPARVVEISSPGGLGEGYLRAGLSNTEPKQLRENIKKYVQGVYEAKDLGPMEMSDPHDLSKPFSLRLEALDSKIGTTYDFEATTTINLWNMTEKFRRYVPAPTEKETTNPPAPRKQDLLFQEPYVTEWVYQIHPPIGFNARTLPAGDTLTFGPASLTRAFELKPDGTVVATFRFDSGKLRWTAAEYEVARQAIGDFGRSAPTSLGFDLTAEAHLSAGRIKESLQAYRDYASSRPGKAAPLGKLAMAQLRGGMGELAREQARRACVLEPESAHAQRTLGYILLHDLVGRPFQKGWDQPGAIKALREAKRLDPSDKLTRRNLAVVLEYNEAGERYGTGAPLDLAITEIQALRKDLKSDELDINLMLALSRTSRFKELEEMVKALSPSSTKSTWMITAAVLNRGAEKALAEAPAMIPDAGSRRTALLSSGDLLLPLRRYQEASAVLSAGAVGSNDASAIRARAAIFAKARQIDDSAFDPKEPASIAWKLLKAILVDGKEGKTLSGYFSPAFWAVAARDPEMNDLQKKVKGSMGAMTRLGLTPRVAFDLAVALCQVVVEGDDARGHKIKFQMPGSKDLSFHVSRIRGQYLVSVMDDQFPMFGIEVVRRLEEGDLSGAKVWLDWVRELAWAGNSEDPLSGAIVCRFWTKGQTASAEEMRLVAEILQVSEKACTQAAPKLVKARAACTDTRRQLDLELALCAAYWAQGDPVKMEPLARRLVAAHPDSKIAARYLSFALEQQKKWLPLIAHCDDLLKQHPDDLAALNLKAHALSALGRQAEKERLLKDLIDRGLATSAEFNNLAWANLMAGKVGDQTLDFARRSMLLKADGNASGLHTLASILAERGDVTEALEVLTKMLKESETAELRSEDWYVFARIAEQFGERELALARYRKVTPPPATQLEEDSCHLLASRRIQTLTSK
jgi:transglutaminase-like putative cysteine protease/tetratricopeptide (TPR) repeat protein